MTPAATPSETPRLALDGALARIVLSRPAQHNAVEARDVAELHNHLDELDANEGVRVIVLTGSGSSSFCSGASLREMESGQMSGELFAALTDRIARARPPVICALNGSAFGGGAEIALACDFRIGVQGMRLAVPAARLGICYPLGGIERVVGALGLATARRILLSAEELDAEELLGCGFLDELVAPDELAEAVDRRARRLVEMAPLSVQAMKRILADVAAGSVDAELVGRLARRCAESADVREGLAARRDGRAASFEGR